MCACLPFSSVFTRPRRGRVGAVTSKHTLEEEGRTYLDRRFLALVFLFELELSSYDELPEELLVEKRFAFVTTHRGLPGSHTRPPSLPSLPSLSLSLSLEPSLPSQLLRDSSWGLG